MASWKIFSEQEQAWNCTSSFFPQCKVHWSPHAYPIPFTHYIQMPASSGTIFVMPSAQPRCHLFKRKMRSSGSAPFMRLSVQGCYGSHAVLNFWAGSGRHSHRLTFCTQAGFPGLRVQSGKGAVSHLSHLVWQHTKAALENLEVESPNHALSAQKVHIQMTVVMVMITSISPKDTWGHSVT